jgi:DNA-binding MarR family transcriptional regulator
VERQRDPADERSLQVTLTDRGWSLRDQAAGIPAAIIERLGMDLKELETLQDVLSDVIAHSKVPHHPALG